MSTVPPIVHHPVLHKTISDLTQQDVEEARDHNALAKHKKEAPDFSGIEGHKIPQNPPDFSGIPGHISHGKAVETDKTAEKGAKTDEQKLDPAVVLYLPAASIKAPAGASCGACWKFLGEKTAKGQCVEVEGSIDGPTGVCGLYINGSVFEGASSQPVPGIVRISKALSGYSEEGPTHCGTCEYYGGDQSSGPCAKVRGTVEFNGCCNRFEPK